MVDQLQGVASGLDKWLGTDTSNYVTYFIIVGAILAVSSITMVVFRRMLGKGNDERTEKIDLKISYTILLTGFIAMVLYISAITKQIEHIQQLALIPFAVMLVAGALATMAEYWKTR
ncbi:MAG TPA: hypothetical protein VGE13_04005 [Candidatus Saccharimonadales bacterium]